MFFKYDELTPGAMAQERHEKADKIADKLPKAEFVSKRRLVVHVKLPDGETIEGDVNHSGFTVYMGGFDWVTFPTPPQIMQKFPQFMPLPQPVLRPSDDKG